MPGNFSQSKTVFSAGSRRAFSLVEMLVVMGVIGILLAVTLPAFKGLNQGSSRRGAVSALMGTLDRARMMAVSDGLPTYVVFACKTPNGNQVNSNLWGRAYAIYQDVDNVSFGLAQRTPWLYLPEGVSFKVEDLQTGDGQSTASVTNQRLVAPGTNANAVDPYFPVGTNALPSASSRSASYVVQLPYWKFDSMGAVDDKAISEQTAGSSGSSEEVARNSYLRVLLFSGRIDGQGKEISTQNNGGPGNKATALLDEIDLNPVTGRARYVVDPMNNLATPTRSPGT